MPRYASPIIFGGWGHPDPNAPDALYSDPRYTVLYERTIMHWTNHVLDWFYQEQDMFQEVESGKWFWPHNGQMIEVTPLTSMSSELYFFEVNESLED